MKVKFSLIVLSIMVVIVSVLGVFGYNKYEDYKGQADYITKEYGNLEGFVKATNGEIFTVYKITTTKAGNGYVSLDSGQQVKFQCTKDTPLYK
jgi:Tfp pilus assembly protein PilE